MDDPADEQVRRHGDGGPLVLHRAPDALPPCRRRRTSAICRPFTTVTITTVSLTDVKDSPVGVNVGVDGTYLITTIKGIGIGVGGFVRFSGASLDLPTTPGMTRDNTDLKAGGPQGGAWACGSVLDELMRILMIAPEPFFEPRGTPFSEYHRIRALLDLGHTVDLVTYPFGKDVTLPGLRIFRAARPPFVTRVKIGPSPAKLFLDMTLTLTALNRARKGRVRRRAFARGRRGDRRRHLCCARHSSSLRHALEPAAAARELRVQPFGGAALDVSAARADGDTRSRVTIVICPHLEVTARSVVPDARVVLIENAPGSGDMPVAGSGTAIRASLGVDASAPMVLYTGTFEAYQGLDLLFAAAKIVREKRPDARFVLAGGKPDQVARAKTQATACRRRRIDLHGRAAVGGDSGVSRRRRCARVTAQHRHEHAVEDLSVSPFGPRHRGHATADAHASAVRRGRDPHRTERRGFRARHPAGHQRSRRRPLASATPQNGSPKRATPTRPTCSARAKPAPRWSRKWGQTLFFQKRKSLQLLGVRRSRRWRRASTRSGLAGPSGTSCSQDQERVLAEFLGDVSGRRVLDMATGTGTQPRWRSRSEARSSPASTRRARC